jgi:hypothetical protein
MNRTYLEHLPIAVLLTAALLVGIFTVKDYGESWDEGDIYRYADYSIGAYRFFLDPGKLAPFETNLNLYGPAYYVATDLGARLVSRIVPAWSPINAWHFIYFLSFLGCALVIYLLSRRWASSAGAIGATVLFLAQPLLWGHAFINPKDIPFMALFSAAILLGLIMVDRYAARHKLDLTILPAAVVLGIAASFRVIGPLSGIIVLGYAGYKLRQRAVAIALPYVILAIIVAYVTWPYLWGSPVSHYIESLQTMSQFPFATLILFKGQLYKANELPRSYFPTLLSLQLTESALLFVGLGLLAAIIALVRRRDWQPLGLFLIWFLLPVVAIIGFGSPLYDNGRQLYFLLPPLFVLTALGFDKLFAVLPSPAVKAGGLLVAALPGLLLGVRLHPYEYIYYNILAGGTGAAFRTFEMDYWGTSLKELTEHINATAAPASRVLVFGPEQIVAAYARPDIQTGIPGEGTDGGYNYAVLLTRENLDERRCKGAPTIYEIERRGAIFAVLKKIPAGVICN